ncbi:MAG: TIR domain-containing protein, partial [Chloroflexota bacterium]
MTADRSPTPATFDVFLSYNGKDRPQVEAIAERLRRAGLSPWFDKWSLVPGGDYQPELFAGLQASGACAYFVGPHGEGDWSRMELGVARSRAAKERAFRLFPVLLPGLPEPFDRTTLPPFLSQRTWIDFRGGVHDRAALQALINAISGVPTGLPVVEPEAGRAPYRGLLPFGETDAEFFFGRDADIQRLVEKLRGDRFLAVLGPSGSGKSSVVSAGLVPAIRTGAIGGSEGWPIRALRPGALPLTAIAAELADALGRPAGGVLDELAADERTLHLASEALLRGQAAEARVCWVVDQAEELFTLCHDDAERSLFVANLAYAAAIPGGRTTIVLTIRADFYARLAAHPNLAALVADSQYLVSPLDADGLRAAIEEPAHRVGLEFEEGLIETILDDVVDRPGTLPLLEHALLELWQRRRGTMLTLEGYRASGGVEGALAQRAETTYASFSPAEQGIVRRALLRLTEPGEGTDDTRRRAPMSELIGSPLQAESVATVVNRLADARLVTVSPGVLPADAWVDLSHEALIRGWPRIRAWIDEDRQSLRTLRRLTEAAADWDRAGRDRDLLLRGARLAESIEWRVDREADLNELERAFLDASVEQRDAASRTRDRRRRLVTTISLGLTAVLLGLTVLAGLQWQRADAAASEALRAAALASARQLAAQATSSSTRLDLGLLLSIESGRLSDQVDVRASLLTSLYRDPAVTSFLTGHADAVDSVAFSPDGRTLASGSSDSSVILWDVATRTRIGEPLPSPTGGVYSVAFSPDGRTLAGGTSEDSVILWDVATRSPIGEPLHTQTGVASVAFSPDGRTLASSTNGGIILWDVASRARIGEALTGHGGSVFSVAFSPDGRTLAGGTPDTGVILWDVASRTRIGEPLTGHADRVHSVAFSPDGRTLASGSEDSSVILWDVASRGRIGEPLTGHTGGVHSVAFSPDGRTLASGT